MIDQTLLQLKRNPGLLQHLPRQEKEEILALLDELEQRKVRKAAHTGLLTFIKYIDPEYKIGAHHKKVAELLEAMARGEKDRLAVSIAPRMGKSYLISYYFPAWYLANYPRKSIMMVTHTADLAVDFGRKVRNLVDSDRYKELFPGIMLAADSKSAGRWNTNHGGSYFAVGVGGAIAGRGADLLLCDDPHNEQDIKNGNMDAFDKTYEWFTTGARTRLMPGGQIAIIHCLVGDTRVLMASGGEKLLRDVRPGDSVLSYERGAVTPARVLNWASQGLDRVFTIALNSGNIITGNERHPFLVNVNGVEQWIQLRDLKPGMLLVSLRGVHVPRTAKHIEGCARFATTKNITERKKKAGWLHRLSCGFMFALPPDVEGRPNQDANPGGAQHVSHERITTKRIPALSIYPLGTTASGKVRHALLMVAGLLRGLKGIVQRVIQNSSTSAARLRASHMTHSSAESGISRLAMALQPLSTRLCLSLNAVGAQSVNQSQLTTTRRRIGSTTNLLLTTATLQGKSEDCCVTPVTSSSCTETELMFSNAPPNTSDFILDRIELITPSGEAEVFDIQVEGTENFIANNLVTHNTRWATNDLIGRLTKDMVMNEGADQYEIVEFPAILEKEVEVEVQDPNDPDNPDAKIKATEVVQKSLWPEQWPLEALLRTKASMPAYQWNAQYMQAPTSEEGALVKREWWRVWEKEAPPFPDFIVQAWDTAFEKNNRSDYSACTTWGVWYPEAAPDDPTSGKANIILLDAIKDRMEFPELKEVAYKKFKEWESYGVPITLIVEKKASGAPLIYELRQRGLVVGEYTPSKGHDKIARVNSITDMFASGMVWAPQTRWAEEVINELAEFPAGAHDDYVDSITLALRRIRQGGFVRLPKDEEDEVRPFRRRSSGYY